ncbi:quaternary amine ABC transporter ATP-binding protein [Sedimentibacter sp. MB31-C6]|uniref:quaternary amine ABC transporter ATP-binding protein n=1 Tax=Sedimentibacter sp. MB31-C6 TaxID=3109366 RepID=UPI002DDD6E60|nr:glycine betaine/L-proline ABC transporter ATP-binding protein [Sedimentibacter sp. MB36-C1]WSI02911.1 glycine betaine/L-proline ABC transporter ATP-binding protein [Sedimentibacter sp. MB36-C1]
MNDNIIEVKNITKLYGINKKEAAKMMNESSNKDEVYKKTGVTVALWDVSFKVKQGEIFVIIGLSGSGKSTLVRCFNGLLKPTSGEITYNGKNVKSFSKKELIEFRRNKISMVFQNFGLMSHRNVMDNIAYGLEVKGMRREERQKRAIEMTKLVGLDGWEYKSINSLSGGMKQRVGLARALANNPEILLMDEPFSALDPLVRKDMHFELLSIQRKIGNTVIFITHDINEAFKLGDTVAIMRDGKVVQIDTPENMTTNPADDYVKKFIVSADKTKVVSVKNIMITPSCMVRENDSAKTAIREMQQNSVSTAYAVDSKMRYKGIVSIDDAIKANKENIKLFDLIKTDDYTVNEDTLINDIITFAAEAKHPIAVVNEDGVLRGIISKAAVLSSLAD